jgi:hypothetical protein
MYKAFTLLQDSVCAAKRDQAVATASAAHTAARARWGQYEMPLIMQYAANNLARPHKRYIMCQLPSSLQPPALLQLLR